MEDLKEFSLGIGKQFIPFTDKDEMTEIWEQENFPEENKNEFQISTASFDSFYNENDSQNSKISEDSEIKSEVEDIIKKEDFNENDYNKEIVQKQVEMIHSLEEEIIKNKQVIEHLEIKAKLVEIYKEKNVNYKQQIEAFEQNLIIDENERVLKSEWINKNVAETEERFNSLLLKMQNLSNENVHLKNQNEELFESKNSIEARLSKRSKELKEMTKGLKAEFEQHKNQTAVFIKNLEEKLGNSMKLKQRLELKITDLKSQLALKREEWKTNKEKDHNLVDKLRKEVEKYKKNNQELVSKNERLKEDKERREISEKRIKECSHKLEKMNKEIDLERKKNTRFLKENSSLKKELEAIKVKIWGDNHPDILKSKIIDQNNKIMNLRKENSNKAKEISNLVQKVEKNTLDCKEVNNYLVSEFKCLSTWIESCLSSKYVFSMSMPEKDSDSYKLPKCIDFPKIIDK